MRPCTVSRAPPAQLTLAGSLLCLVPSMLGSVRAEHGMSPESGLGFSFRALVLHFPCVQQVLEMSCLEDAGFGACE